jgi:Ca2+-binding EF-hand superfamily protein
MRIADADGDGRLTADEYVRWTRALMRLPEEHTREVFRHSDTNADGYLTTSEVLDIIRGYYFDNEPETAPAWMLDLPSEL